jgi:hypothetical protein
MPTTNEAAENKRNLKSYTPSWEGNTYTEGAENVEGFTKQIL